MKKLTTKQNMWIANVLMGAGVIYNLYDLYVNGYELKPIPTIVSVTLVVVGAVWRYVLVKCPHCGCKLPGIHTVGKLPGRCPECNGRLDKLPEKTEE